MESTMKIFTFVILALLLGACHTIPKNFEDENVFVIKHKVYIRHVDKITEEQKEQIRKDYTEPHLDEEEKKALKGRMFGEGADLATTLVGIGLGCVEANPLVAWGGVPAIIASKGLGYWSAKNYAKATPKAFSSAKKTKKGNYVLYGAGAWNMLMIAQGCV
jgi:hypothetical protein